MNKTFLTFIITLFFSAYSMGQLAPERYVVFFNTKQGTPYTLTQPNEFLSARAIENRNKRGIQIDSLDLPVNPRFIDSLNSVVPRVLYTSRWLNFAVVEASAEQISDVESFTFVKEFREKKTSQKSLKEQKDSKFELEQQLFFAGDPNTKEVQEQINLGALHDFGFFGENVRIAIIDAGFTGLNTMEAFQHLFDENRLIATANFAEDNTVFYGHTHGTSVGSIMCGNLGDNYMGAAPNAEYVLIRSETGSTEYLVEEYNWVAAAEFADSLGVDVINSSLGYTRFDWPAQDHTYDDLDGESTIISRAAGIAFQKGMLVVVSAGNHGNDSWQYISVPADHPNVLAVGSVDINGELSYFSSTGLTSHQFKPNIVACGEYAPYVYSDMVYNGNGTSYASPLVAGAAACLWQAFPEKTPGELFDAIQQSSSKKSNPDNLYGYGIPDFFNAYFILNESPFMPEDTNEAEIVHAYTDKSENIFMHIYVPESVSGQIRVFDSYGRLVHSERCNLKEKRTTKVEIRGLGSGIDSQVLLLNVKGGSVNTTRKIFVE